jgi:hypothetical protein
VPADAAAGAPLATEAANSHDVTNIGLAALITIRGVDDEKRMFGVKFARGTSLTIP